MFTVNVNVKSQIGWYLIYQLIVHRQRIFAPKYPIYIKNIQFLYCKYIQSCSTTSRFVTLFSLRDFSFWVQGFTALVRERLWASLIDKNLWVTSPNPKPTSVLKLKQKHSLSLTSVKVFSCLNPTFVLHIIHPQSIPATSLQLAFP